MMTGVPETDAVPMSPAWSEAGMDHAVAAPDLVV
jgi:hypothetical protein